MTLKVKLVSHPETGHLSSRRLLPRISFVFGFVRCSERYPWSKLAFAWTGLDVMRDGSLFTFVDILSKTDFSLELPPWLGMLRWICLICSGNITQGNIYIHFSNYRVARLLGNNLPLTWF